MKQMFILGLLLPLLTMAQQNPEQIVSAQRVFPKVDRVAEFEKAIAAHAQKYHTGKWKWRIFSVESGPDFGGYQINEGPNTWEEIEGRGDLGAAHMNDWNKSVAIHLLDKQTHNYASFMPDYSNVSITDYSDWINITRWYQKPGHANDIQAIMMKMKAAWAEGKESVAVYSASSSGPPGYSIVTRYKQGLKERGNGFRPPFRERYEKVNGANSWDSFMKGIQEHLENSWSELLHYRADLSSK
jgi:hypothetical protein